MDEYDDSISGMVNQMVMAKVRAMEACIEAVMKETGCPRAEVRLRWLGVGKGFAAYRESVPQTEQPE